MQQRGWRGWGREWQGVPSYLKAMVVGGAAATTVLVASHVETMPLTGRRRIMFFSSRSEERLGENAYREIMRTNKILPPSHSMSLAVSRVGRKIERLAENPDMRWKFHVVDSDVPNAFCLPGGKVFVHTGLFKILKNEDSLAAVMFHEAAHGIARHGAEKISFSLLVYGLLALILPDYGQLSDLMVKLVVDLPFSRSLELEADAVGLQLMAKACYDPRESIQMNQALEKAASKHGVTPPKYFSTHPPSHERIQALKGQLKDAMNVYNAQDCGALRSSFRRAVKSK